jgi:hypothetical protein
VSFAVVPRLMDGAVPDATAATPAGRQRWDCLPADRHHPTRHCQVDGLGVFGCLVWVGVRLGFVDATSSWHKGYRYPVEIISHCVWLYHRFPLSLREVEEMMLARGVLVTYESIHQ